MQDFTCESTLESFDVKNNILEKILELQERQNKLQEINNSLSIENIQLQTKIHELRYQNKQLHSSDDVQNDRINLQQRNTRLEGMLQESYKEIERIQKFAEQYNVIKIERDKLEEEQSAFVQKLQIKDKQIADLQSITQKFKEQLQISNKMLQSLQQSKDIISLSIEWISPKIEIKQDNQANGFKQLIQQKVNSIYLINNHDKTNPNAFANSDLSILVKDMKQQIDEIKTINDMYNKALNRNESPIKFDVYNFDDNTLDNSMQYTPSSLSIEIELDDNSSRISKLKDDKRVLKIQLTELQQKYDKLLCEKPQSPRDDPTFMLSTQNSLGNIFTGFISSQLRQLTPEPILDDDSDSIASPSINSSNTSGISDF